MIRILNTKQFAKTLLFFTTIFSYYLFLILYDSTTGIDYPNKYGAYISYFTFDQEIKFKDGQGIMYYFFISLVVNLFKSNIGPYNLNEILSNSIQLGNFILTALMFLGLFKLYTHYRYSKKTIYFSLSILNFFPPLIYLRLTFKSEIMAAALLPWVILYFQKIKLHSGKLKYNYFIFVFLFSLMLTIKPSISAMLILCFVFLERNNLKNHFFIFSISILSIFILLVINYQITDNNFLYHSSSGNGTLWDNKATFSFFTKLNIINLIKEPFFNKQSNSLSAILLLDTYSDYFKFFWKHKESSNYLAFGQLDFTTNFFINRYLRDYLAVISSGFTYFIFIYSYLKSKKENKEIYLFPFIGIIILSISALGIPSNNFNPFTGDTFKVHYFAFLLSLSFLHLLVNLRNQKILILLIPFFIFLMGFPKDNFQTNYFIYKNKLRNTEMCYILDSFTNCNSYYVTICKSVNNSIAFDDKFSKNYFFMQPVLLKKGNKEKYARDTRECLQLLNDNYSFISYD